MAGTGKTFIRGHDRQALYSNVAASFTGSAGAAFGAFRCDEFSRFTGLLSVIGSATMRYQLGVNSGTYQVNSTFAVNSGGSVFDVLNPGGRVVNWGFTQAASQENAVVNIIGEPLR